MINLMGWLIVIMINFTISLPICLTIGGQGDLIKYIKNHKCSFTLLFIFLPLPTIFSCILLTLIDSVEKLIEFIKKIDEKLVDKH